VNEFGSRRLVAAVVEQAIHDRRLAVTHGIVDGLARPIPPLSTLESEYTAHLHSFFVGGGVEQAIESAAFNISIEAIRRKSIEPFNGKGREER
jgi:hypothetical protein